MGSEAKLCRQKEGIEEVYLNLGVFVRSTLNCLQRVLTCCILCILSVAFLINKHGTQVELLHLGSKMLCFDYIPGQ